MCLKTRSKEYVNKMIDVQISSRLYLLVVTSPKEVRYACELKLVIIPPKAYVYINSKIKFEINCFLVCLKAKLIISKAVVNLSIFSSGLFSINKIIKMLEIDPTMLANNILKKFFL